MVKMKMIILLGLMGLANFGYATQFRSETTMAVERHEIISEDWYAASELLSFYGSALQDVWVAASKAYFWGVIGQDLNLLVDQGEVKGQIGDDLRIIGNKLNIASKVSGSFLFLGNHLLLQKESQLGGDAIIWAKDITINGMIQGPTRIHCQEVIINGTINNDVTINAQSITFGEQASILGDLNYSTPMRGNHEMSAYVKGSLNWIKAATEENKEPWLYQLDKVWFAGKLFFRITILLGLLIVGVLLIIFLPKQTNTYTLAISSQPLPALGWGLLTIIGTPLLMVLFIITILGIPAALVLAVFYILLLIVTKLGIALWLGHYLLRPKVDQQFKFIIGLVLGLVLLTALDMVPFLGNVINFIVMVFGAGGLWLIKGNKEKNKKESRITSAQLTKPLTETTAIKTKPLLESEPPQIENWEPSPPAFLKSGQVKKSRQKTTKKSTTKKLVKAKKTNTRKKVVTKSKNVKKTTKKTTKKVVKKR